MSRIHRRSTKAETRLETLEGRITPSGMSVQSVIGAQILVLSPDSGVTRTGLTKAESLALKHYDHIQNAMKAEIFLSHHHRLEMWLNQVSYYPGAPVSTVPTQANTGATQTTQSPGTSPNQTGSGSTTPSSNSDPGKATTIGAQDVVDATQPGNTTAGDTTGTTSSSNSSSGQSSTASLDATLNQLYKSYKDGGIDQAKSQYAKMAIFSGNNVGVTIHGNGANFQALLDEVASLDPQISVTRSDSTYQMIVAYVPIADLVSLAPDADHLVQSVTALTPPLLK